MTSTVLDIIFSGPRPPKDTWFYTGLASSYPDITNSDSVALSSRIQCGDAALLGCKVFHVPPNDSSAAAELDIDEAVAAKLDNQVLIFQFRNKFYAVDHVRTLRISQTANCRRPGVSGVLPLHGQS